MENCIFCKIVAGALPCHKVYEDANFLAFLDIHPQSAGHTLVIPKNHHRYVWDVPNAGTYFEVATKIANAQRKAFGVELIRGNIYGDEVPHAHIWVFPLPSESTLPKDDFAANAEKIRAALANI